MADHANARTRSIDRRSHQGLATNRAAAASMSAMNIGGLLNTRNGLSADAQLRHQLQQHPMHMDAHSAYGMGHPAMGHHQHSLSQPSAFLAQMSAPQQQMMSASYMTAHGRPTGTNQMDPNENRPRSEPVPKAFACSTCSKGFARRSDLARHERIHSGIRPHACDYPGCGKEFIQRSALTVHTRVHTGEKPHMCERCGKPFSDSSSLARHRRIHSGKRPYKCPYANCQKTFTRRTTLTRHQNHHTGTVEQAQAETNAKLSMTQSQSQPHSANGSYSEPDRNSTASPSQGLAVSPHQAMNSMQAIAQQNSDFQFMSHPNSALSQHMRPEYHTHPGRVNHPLSTTSVGAYNGMTQTRMNMTSHPGNNFGAPPQPMEPPTIGHANGNGSPHMNSMAWGSPTNPGLNGQTTMDAFYQEHSAFANQPGAGYGGPGMYYTGATLRRPQSTEPDDYGLRSRSHISHHLAAGTLPMNDPGWMQMQQRDYAVGH